MIKRSVILFIVILLIADDATAQFDSNTQQEITLQDLKPTVNYAQSSPFFQPIREKPGLALLSSALIPGSAQAANKKWIRAGLYLLADAAFVGIHLKSFHNAKAEERRYKKFANNNWSVVTYARWLVNYHDENNLPNPYLTELKNEIAGKSASYNPQEDWKKIDIELLRNVERNTSFVYSDGRMGNKFSHEMPDYGSQQYYELISKYYQYGPGWNGFGQNRNGNSLDSRYQLQWNGTDMPLGFIRGSTLAEDFNDSYRLAGNMITLLILNHIVSAFDAFLTVKIKNNRLEANSNFINPRKAVSFKFHF